MHEIIDIGNGIYVVDGTPCVLNPETGLFIICGVNIDGAAYIFDDEGQPVLLEIPEDAVRMYTVDDTGNSDPDISGNENTDNTDPGIDE